MTTARINPFSIDILDQSGSKLGGGPLVNIVRISETRRLSAVGDLSFTLPAADPRAALIVPGVLFDIYDRKDGYLGRYVFKKVSIDDSIGRAMLTVDCWDALRLLVYRTVGFKRTYTNAFIDVVAADLAAVAPGWAINGENTSTRVGIGFEGETVYNALATLAGQTGRYFRLDDYQSVGFGVFGAASGVRLTHLRGQIAGEGSALRSIGVITHLKQTVSGEEIYNRIIPIGGSVAGGAQLTIRTATGGTYTIKTGVGGSGEYYYIEDAASIAAYGVRERVLSVPSIAPGSTVSSFTIQQAASALKAAAESYLVQHKDPLTEYAVTCANLPPDVKIGDKVRLAYKGVTDDQVYLNVDADLYVTDLNIVRDAGGSKTVKVGVSSTLDKRTDDAGLMAAVIGDQRTTKLYAQPTTSWMTDTQSDVVQAHSSAAYNRRARFYLRIDDSIVDVNQILLRFETRRLYTTATFTWSGSPATARSAGYTLSEDVNNMAGGLRLYINGADVTAQFGGPWNPSDANSGVTVELDITALIKGGTLKQTHIIEIEASQRSGTVTELSSPIAQSGEASHSLVIATFNVLALAQGYLEL